MPNPNPYFTDGVFSFEGGLNAGINPLLLQRNQLAAANNCTVRGTFITHRPARRQVSLTYAGGIQSAVEDSLFQGACFYNSDTSTSSLIALISGQLFNFTLTSAGASVSDISIPNDPDSTTAPIAWLWQSENYVIVNDGENLPIFYDGVSSRRSFGDAATLGAISMNFTVPNVNASVAVTLSAAYTGQYNVPVLINNALYQVVPPIPPTPAEQYQVTLTNLSGTPGAAHIANEQILNRPSVFIVAPTTFSIFTQAGATVDFAANGWTRPAGTVAGAKFQALGAIWTIFADGLTPPAFLASPNVSLGTVTFTQGMVILKSPATAPNTVAAIVRTAFATPAVGSPVTVNVTTPYVGTANASVFLGDSQFTIAAVVPTAPGLTATIVNKTDTPAATRVAPLSITSTPELPAGRMGAYGMGRNWVSLIDGISFIAGDIVGGSSGTLPFDGRDSVLKISENTYLNGGGVFRVPGTVGDIRAMRFATTLDVSLGQGPLQVFTPTTVFSVNTPVDRTTWQNLTNPILTESLIANGAQGQNSTVAANGDTFMRAIDGLRSLILARREFATWGNVPISYEVSPTLSQDDKSLLQYGSAIVFDNRLLFTASPASSSQGVYHETAVALNFDPLSTLGQKNPPVYDGFWDGLNVLQYITGLYNGVQRAFAFALNTTTNKIELWEILPTDEATNDNGTRIQWDFATGSIFKDIQGKGPFDYCQLTDGEVFVDSVLGAVDFAVSYKPDEYSAWVPWHSWSIENIGTAPRSFPRMGLGEPSANDFNPDTEKQLRIGYTFQIKVEVTGHCRFLGARFKATPQAQPQFAKPVCATNSTTGE